MTATCLTPPSNLPNRSDPVVVGLSGGVDSAVTAALLLKWGYRVEGITLRLFDGAAAESSERAAQHVGEHLGIPVTVMEGRALFDAVVLRPFVEAYGANRTPSPCCLCNPGVKFRLLFEAASKLGAQAVATGHYVRKEWQDGIPVLKAATDRSRDQSYFLYGLTETQLEKAFFPLETADKPSVRTYASELGLPVSTRPDSQDLCFLSGGRKGHGAYADFVRGYATARGIDASGFQPGPIEDAEGHLLGKHAGAYLYTIGQRRGLGVSARDPLYVIQLEGNRVVVGPRQPVQSVLVEVWHESPLGRHLPDEALLAAQFRSTMEPTPVSIERLSDGSRVRVSFLVPQYGVAPGQVLVLRSEEGAILGGGVIG